MISLQNIEISLAGRPVLKGVDFQIRDGECVAVVGPNGCGKSTLLRLISGRMNPDGGQISIPTKTSVGYLPQEADLAVTHSVLDEMKDAFAEILDAREEMTSIEQQMAQVVPGSPEYQKISERYADLAHFVEIRDGYAIDAQIARVATGLGFSEDDLARSCQEFSGGWKMRILLAKLLLTLPDVLLLDEPTNHLDLESTLWLEEWIREARRTVVMVSHERAFMDRLVSRILCLEMGTGEVYNGNYSNYLKQSKLRREQHQKAYEEQAREIEQIEAFIRRFRYNSSKASLVQSRIKQLEKIKRLEAPFYGEAIHFKFPDAPKSYREVVILENLSKSFGDLEVLSNIDWTAYRGERIGLVGPNGAGKTTLLKIIAGRIEPTDGSCRLGGNVSMAYFAQEDTSSLSSEETLLEAIQQQAPAGMAQQGRNLLGAFLFSGDDAGKPLKVLSGGERTRFRLAQMLFSPSNLLLLDEPTNHLDVTSRATVEDALKDFSGTVILVSHDRVFMEQVTTKIVELQNGKMSIYPGTYAEYIDNKQSAVGTILDDDGSPAIGSEVPISKEERIDRYEANKARNRRLESLRKSIRELEDRIESTECEIEELHETMSQPSVASNFAKLSEYTQARDRLTETNEQLLAQWESMHHELEQLEKEES